MFTGIINHVGSVRSVVADQDTQNVCLEIEHCYQAVARGESIAVNGVCLTARPVADNVIACDLSPETRTCTMLGSLCPGDAVNLERSLSLSDRLGGHFVTGHVDQVCRVCTVTTYGDFTEWTIDQVGSTYQRYLLPKGSITLDGVSLTVNAVNNDGFAVMLIPETRQKTTLSAVRPRTCVNVEFDFLAKVVARQLEACTVNSDSFKKRLTGD